jgi:hypothetical protein
MRFPSRREQLDRSPVHKYAGLTAGVQREPDERALEERGQEARRPGLRVRSATPQPNAQVMLVGEPRQDWSSQLVIGEPELETRGPRSRLSSREDQLAPDQLIENALLGCRRIRFAKSSQRCSEAIVAHSGFDQFRERHREMLSL